MSFERKVLFRPAYDKRNVDPKKNYGIHGLEIQFQLIGALGGVTYTIFTNWNLPNVQAEMDAKPLDSRFPYMLHKPQTAGLDGHWKMATYPEQTAIEGCKITGGNCYCDGTSLTQDLFDKLVAEGDEAVWRELERRYEAWKPTGACVA